MSLAKYLMQKKRVYQFPNATIIDSISAEGIQALDMTFANGNLIRGNYDTGRFYVHDGFSETIIDDFAWPGTNSIAGPSGAAFDGVNFISADHGSNDIDIHSGISEVVTSSFSAPAEYPRGLEVVDGNLISLDRRAEQVYFHTGITAAFYDDRAMPSGSGSHKTGVTWDGVNLIIGRGNTLYVYDGLSSTVLETIPLGFYLNSLAFDGKNVVVAQEYTANIVKLGKG